MAAAKELNNTQTQEQPGPGLNGYDNEFGGVTSSKDSPVIVEPSRVTAGKGGVEAGTNAAEMALNYKDKWYIPTVAQKAAESIESDDVTRTKLKLLRYGEWLMGFFKSPGKPKRDPGKGYEWLYHSGIGLYYRSPIGAKKQKEYSKSARNRSRPDKRYNSSGGGW